MTGLEIFVVGVVGSGIVRLIIINRKKSAKRYRVVDGKGNVHEGEVSGETVRRESANLDYSSGQAAQHWPKHGGTTSYTKPTRK
jgi:hypothetical protein